MAVTKKASGMKEAMKVARATYEEGGNEGNI